MKKLFKNPWLWIIIVAGLSFIVFQKINLIGIIDPLSEGAEILAHIFAASITGVLLHPLLAIIFPEKK
jgi:hypothetical protein